MVKKIKLIKLKRIRLIFWLALLGLVLFLLWQSIVPSGRITYVNNFFWYSDFVGNLSPKERVASPHDGQQIVLGNPVYFTLRTPRPFSQARLTIEYQNKVKNLPIMELGVLVDKALWRYDLKPIQNRIIDQTIEGGWSKLTKNSLTLLQRQPRYSSLDSFWQSPPAQSQIATYNYRLPFKYYLSDYSASPTFANYSYALRGSYQFYTYLDQEDLIFNFSFKDLNLKEGADQVEIILYNQNDERLDERLLPDDGQTGISDKVSLNRSVSLFRSNLPTGVYKIEVKTSDDIVTNSLSTTQSKLSFINKLWLAKAEQANITLYSDSQAISLQTHNPASLQTAKVNGRSLRLPATYEQFTLVNKALVNVINLPRGDVIISGPGVFGFSQNGLVDPNSSAINNFSELTSKTNYIVANYQTPQKKDEWQTATLNFDLSQAVREDDQYSFLLSVPGLKLEDQLADQIIIKKIKVELTGKSLWQKILEIKN